MVAHRVFLDVEFGFKFLEEEHQLRMKNPDRKDRFSFWDQALILDIIAGIHNLKFELKEPNRTKQAREHLKKMISLSRQMWESIRAETDNDREWIPNAKQVSAASRAKVSEDMIVAWVDFLDELDELLDGKKLVPFWRGTDKTRGINLKKVFLEPRDLDLVLWFHGSGAMPYVEFGECSDAATWGRFNRVFRGEFFGFAVWFN
ncbi:MAG: hypothetical protein AAFN77_24445 [Planctomycetota bacterium]